MSPPCSRFWHLLGVLVAAAVAAGMAARHAARRWLDLVEVDGRSMAPTLEPGDRLLVESRTLTRRPPRPGELVLAPDPRETERELVKRVAAVDAVAGTITLAGDAPWASSDSRTFGPLPFAAVRWRVLARTWPLGRVGPLRRQPSRELPHR